MHFITDLLNVVKVLRIPTRQLGKNVYKWNGEGIQYPGIKYYPSRNDGDYPPCVPAKLFRVERVKPVKGTPYWERKLLEEFKLDGKPKYFTVVKNIPEINARLWRIKHLIKITPINLPDEMPEDLSGIRLKANGDVVVIRKVHESSERMEASDNFENDAKKLNGDVIRRELRKKWLSGW